MFYRRITNNNKNTNVELKQNKKNIKTQKENNTKERNVSTIWNRDFFFNDQCIKKYFSIFLKVETPSETANGAVL